MVFSDGLMYTVGKVAQSHQLWKEVEEAVTRRINPAAGVGSLSLLELYDVRWRSKPFPWSYSNEFKPHRRWFYHGTDSYTIARILDEGFKIGTARTGRMLGDGVYATYHTNKGKSYGTDGYVISVMVYAPNSLVVHSGQFVDQSTITTTCLRYDALEVRKGAVVANYAMKNHEICVFDTRRIIPRFIIKIA
jgi:hypothetical protein